MGSKLSEFVLKMCPVHSQTQTLVDDDAFLASLQQSNGVACSVSQSAVLLKHKKIVSSCERQAVASKQESCGDSMSSSLWHRTWASNLIVINLVLGDNLQQGSDMGQVLWKMYI